MIPPKYVKVEKHAKYLEKPVAGEAIGFCFGKR